MERKQSPTPAGQPPSRRTSGPRDDPDVAIVGGGICGLMTAVALEQRGISPTVYEASSADQPVASGVLLRTNAMLVFDRLGLADTSLPRRGTGDTDPAVSPG